MARSSASGPRQRSWRGEILGALRLRHGVVCQPQPPGDLGQRMARAVEAGVQLGLPVLLIGTDCPQLTAQLLRQAAEGLARHDSVMFPARDGGYVLLGLRQMKMRLRRRAGVVYRAMRRVLTR